MSVSERGESEIEGNGMGARGRESGRDGVIGKDSAGERGEKWLWWVGGGRKYQTYLVFRQIYHLKRIMHVFFWGGCELKSRHVHNCAYQLHLYMPAMATAPKVAL